MTPMKDCYNSTAKKEYPLTNEDSPHHPHAQTLPIENKGKIRQSYKIGHVIAESSLGHIRKCLQIRTGQVRACKFIPKASIESSISMKNKLTEELELLSQLDHPNIVKCYESFQDSKRYYLILE